MKYITSLMALCLALFADRALAIGITTTTIPGNEGSLRSYVHVTPPGVTDLLAMPIGVERFSPLETSVEQPNISASQTWSMQNGGNVATIRGKGDIVVNAAQVNDFTIDTTTELYLNFTLTEAVNFTLSTSFSGTSNPGAAAHTGAHIYNVGTITTVYRFNALATTSGDFLLSSGDVVGTLLPGTYQLNHHSGMSDSVEFEGVGSFLYELRMTSITGGPNRVPDAGSTLGLLVFALGGLCAFRKPVR